MFLALLLSGAANFRHALSSVVVCLVGGVVGLCTRLLWHHRLLVLLLIGAGVTFLSVRVLSLLLLLVLLLLVLLLVSLMTTVTTLVIQMSCLFFSRATGAVKWLLACHCSLHLLLRLLVLGRRLHVGGIGEGVGARV